MNTTIVHFHRAENPKQTLVAIADDSGIFRCEIPFISHNHRVDTVEIEIDKDTMAVNLQLKYWVATKINGIAVTELSKSWTSTK
jgi:hypothetical protein